MLGNVANEILLKEAGHRITDVILSSVSTGIDSPDRFIVISCLEILNKISQQDCNEEIITLGLEDTVYEIICRLILTFLFYLLNKNLFNENLISKGIIFILESIFFFIHLYPRGKLNSCLTENFE